MSDFSRLLLCLSAPLSSLAVLVYYTQGVSNRKDNSCCLSIKNNATSTFPKYALIQEPSLAPHCSWDLHLALVLPACGFPIHRAPQTPPSLPLLQGRALCHPLCLAAFWAAVQTPLPGGLSRTPRAMGGPAPNSGSALVVPKIAVFTTGLCILSLGFLAHYMDNVLKPENKFIKIMSKKIRMTAMVTVCVCYVTSTIQYLHVSPGGPLLSRYMLFHLQVKLKEQLRDSESPMVMHICLAQR